MNSRGGSRVASEGNAPKLRVDHREHASELVEALRETYGVQVEFAALKYGDYFVPPDTVVERKTVRDFCISLVDGRLFRQAYRLVENTDTPILLIEGASFADQDTGVSMHAIRGALITLAQTFRLPVLRSRGPKDSAWHLVGLYRRRARLGEHRGTLAGYSPKRIETRKLYVLRMLPGVGPKLARALLEEFGSVERVVGASAAALAVVPGIGARRAEQIREVLREEYGSYDALTPTGRAEKPG